MLQSHVAAIFVKKHLVEASGHITFQCGICQVEHYVPKEGFAINKRIQNALDIQLNTVKFNPVFEECKREIEKAKENASKIERNSEDYIYQYFEEIKRTVDLRREDLKLKIDTFSDKIIQSVESTKENCLQLSIKVNQLTTELDKSKRELSELIARLDTFDTNEANFRDVMKKGVVLNETISQLLNGYKDSLIGNKEYSFEFKEMKIEDVFGKFDVNEKVFCSIYFPTSL